MNRQQWVRLTADLGFLVGVATPLALESSSIFRCFMSSDKKMAPMLAKSINHLLLPVPLSGLLGAGVGVVVGRFWCYLGLMQPLSRIQLLSGMVIIGFLVSLLLFLGEYPLSMLMHLVLAVKEAALLELLCHESEEGRITHHIFQSSAMLTPLLVRSMVGTGFGLVFGLCLWVANAKLTDR